jgi:hypothetical protein
MILKGESAEEFNRKADENYEKMKARKAKQKKALVAMMKADEKDGLYQRIFSDCCSAYPVDASEDMGLCPMCMEHCEYITETEYLISTDANRKRLKESIEQIPTLKGVDTLEVIDDSGFSYVNRNDKNVVEISFQDDGKTMKIFISKKK